MVEERYWTCGVGGLWGFKRGWPGRLEGSQAGELRMDGMAMTPRVRPRADWAGRELCQRPGVSERGLDTEPTVGLLSQLAWPLQFQPCSSPGLCPLLPPLRSAPLSLCCPTASQCPRSSLPTPASLSESHRGPQCSPLRPPDAYPTLSPPSLNPAGWAPPQGTLSALTAPFRRQMLAENPALLKRACQVQLALSV